MAGEVLFQEAGITITKALLTTPQQSISIANVAGVSKLIETPNKKLATRLVVVGILTLLLGVGLILLVIGIVMLTKKQYVVQLDTSSGKSEAFRSKDEALVDRIVGAVTKAIAARG